MTNKVINLDEWKEKHYSPGFSHIEITTLRLNVFLNILFLFFGGVYLITSGMMIWLSIPIGISLSCLAILQFKKMVFVNKNQYNLSQHIRFILLHHYALVVLIYATWCIATLLALFTSTSWIFSILTGIFGIWNIMMMIRFTDKEPA